MPSSTLLEQSGEDEEGRFGVKQMNMNRRQALTAMGLCVAVAPEVAECAPADGWVSSAEFRRWIEERSALYGIAIESGPIPHPVESRYQFRARVNGHLITGEIS